MEYRIEDGQATVPLSEINRLNDLAEDLLKREEKFELKKKEYDEKLANSAEYVLMQVRKGAFSVKTHLVSPDKAREDLKNFHTVETNKYIQKQKDSFSKKIATMSVAEFKKWGKHLREEVDTL